MAKVESLTKLMKEVIAVATIGIGSFEQFLADLDVDSLEQKQEFVSCNVFHDYAFVIDVFSTQFDSCFLFGETDGFCLLRGKTVWRFTTEAIGLVTQL